MRVDVFLVEGKGKGKANANAMGLCGSALSAPAGVPIASSIVITILADLTAGKVTLRTASYG
jgi:hypothetical protein